MDYTNLSRVKSAMDSQQNTQDSILEDYITRASRILDKLCTSQPNVVDYFKLEAISNEFLTNGVINYAGVLSVYPHKPIVTTVTEMFYRFTMHEAWRPIDLTYTYVLQDTVRFEGNLPQIENIFVKISYSGGLGASLTDLPADFIDLATVLAIRLFKEERSGMSDVVGVVELGTLSYQKAFPARVIDEINASNYARIAPWT